jgi:hypothetical protein
MFIAPHIPVARICVIAMMRGVPVGTHKASLSISNNGWPLDVILIAPVTNMADTHGPLATGGGGNAHPAIM